MTSLSQKPRTGKPQNSRRASVRTPQSARSQAAQASTGFIQIDKDEPKRSRKERRLSQRLTDRNLKRLEFLRDTPTAASLTICANIIIIERKSGGLILADSKSLAPIFSRGASESELIEILEFIDPLKPVNQAIYDKALAIASQQIKEGAA